MKKFDFQLTKEKMASAVGELGVVAKRTIEEMPDKAKEGAKYIEEQYGKAKHEMDLKMYAPIFPDMLPTYEQPALLRVVKFDKRMSVEACQGAVGFEEKIKSEKVFHLYRETAGEQGIRFVPYVDETIYYKNPYEDNSYICLDEYFTYIRKAKISELEKIAYCLGAKYFKVEVKEKKKTIMADKKKANAKVKGVGSTDVSYEHTQDEYSNTEIAAELTFKGNATIQEPELKYFRLSDDIINLVEMRLGANGNQLQKKTYRFDCTTNLDMKEAMAANIDAVLKGLKCTGNATMSSEYQSQKRTILEYTIEF